MKSRTRPGEYSSTANSPAVSRYTGWALRSRGSARPASGTVRGNPSSGWLRAGSHRRWRCVRRRLTEHPHERRREHESLDLVTSCISSPIQCRGKARDLMPRLRQRHSGLCSRVRSQANEIQRRRAAARAPKRTPPSANLLASPREAWRVRPRCRQGRRSGARGPRLPRVQRGLGRDSPHQFGASRPVHPSAVTTPGPPMLSVSAVREFVGLACSGRLLFTDMTHNCANREEQPDSHARRDEPPEELDDDPDDQQ